MPIPGGRLQGLAFDPAQVGTDFYPSLGTFYRATESTAADGQEISTFAAIDSAHSDLGCRLSPFILIRPIGQERFTDSGKMQDAQFQVNFNVYVGDASDEWKVLVDSVLYEILAVEHDGNHLTTRLAVGKIIPFNA